MCLLAMSAQAEARDVTCGEVKAAVAQMPEVKRLDQEAGWFAYRPGGSINVVCPEAGGAVDLTVGFDPLPGPEDWPFLDA
jgi:hypothetical protein